MEEIYERQQKAYNERRDRYLMYPETRKLQSFYAEDTNFIQQLRSAGAKDAATRRIQDKIESLTERKKEMESRIAEIDEELKRLENERGQGK